MAISDNEILALNSQIKTLRSMGRQYGDGVPPSVEFLESKWATSDDEDEIAFFSALLEAEYCWYGLFEELERLHRKMVALFPQQPMVWISLASFLMTQNRALSEARRTVAIGLSRAKQSGQFIRHALNTQARIARALENYDLLAVTIGELVNHRPISGNEDIAYEDDFIRDLPDGKIAANLLELYRSQAPSNR